MAHRTGHPSGLGDWDPGPLCVKGPLPAEAKPTEGDVQERLGIWRGLRARQEGGSGARLGTLASWRTLSCTRWARELGMEVGEMDQGTACLAPWVAWPWEKQAPRHSPPAVSKVPSKPAPPPGEFFHVPLAPGFLMLWVSLGSADPSAPLASIEMNARDVV